ncbi:MAG TPA: alpha/beta hydrolase, partial [Burkholderiales bacterium]|nr:alpha/beta hydrolase [Burkholderiales bacterium]
LEMDQAELDDAYDQSVYAPNGRQISARNATNSELARQRLGPPRRAAYGPSEIEKLDIYIARRANAPINLFIHGGAWRGGNARDFGYAAEMFIGAGAHFVVPDFVKVQDAGGSLFAMVEQVRRAVAWTYRNAASFGGEANRLYVSGRSSGAHLGGVVATTDWKKDFGLPADTVKGYTLSSGMYDLRAPRLSKRGNYVKFTDEMEQALSPQRHLDRIVAPIVLLYGSLETPEFKRQTREFAEALKNAGKQVKLVYAEGYNHYEIAETIGNPYGFVGRAILEQMALAPA